jgi:hypothetical protein
MQIEGVGYCVNVVAEAHGKRRVTFRQRGVTPVVVLRSISTNADR